MSKIDKVNENDIVSEIENEINEFAENEGVNEDKTQIDNLENNEIIEEKDDKCLDKLARTMADFDNFKKRVERDKQDMIFFIKSDILKKILPRLDDLERIIKNSTDADKLSPMYEGIIAMHKLFTSDLEKLGIKSFKSIGEKVNSDFHDVMTTIPGEEGVIIDEFEKGYVIGDRVLRHAKVVAGA